MEYLERWKFEIIRDVESGRFCVNELSINKGRFGGNIVAREIYDAGTFEECAAFCRSHNITFTETRGREI